MLYTHYGENTNRKIKAKPLTWPQASKLLKKGSEVRREETYADKECTLYLLTTEEYGRVSI